MPPLPDAPPPTVPHAVGATTTTPGRRIGVGHIVPPNASTPIQRRSLWLWLTPHASPFGDARSYPHQVLPSYTTDARGEGSRSAPFGRHFALGYGRVWFVMIVPYQPYPTQALPLANTTTHQLNSPSAHLVQASVATTSAIVLLSTLKSTAKSDKDRGPRALGMVLQRAIGYGLPGMARACHLQTQGRLPEYSMKAYPQLACVYVMG